MDLDKLLLLLVLLFRFILLQSQTKAQCLAVTEDKRFNEKTHHIQQCQQSRHKFEKKGVATIINSRKVKCTLMQIKLSRHKTPVHG